MTYWNHRVIELDVSCPEEPHYEIGEVYYKGKRPWDWCQVTVSDGSLDGLKQDLEWMRQALEKPVLKESGFTGGKP